MRKIKVLLILLILPVLNGRAFTEKELVADGQEKNRTQERSGVPSTGDVDVASLEIDASRLGAPIQSTMYGVFLKILILEPMVGCMLNLSRIALLNFRNL